MVCFGVINQLIDLYRKQLIKFLLKNSFLDPILLEGSNVATCTNIFRNTTKVCHLWRNDKFLSDLLEILSNEKKNDR